MVTFYVQRSAAYENSSFLQSLVPGVFIMPHLDLFMSTYDCILTYVPFHVE